MKDTIDIMKLKSSCNIRKLTAMALVNQTSEYIKLIAEELRDARQPFYRIWYYQRQGWKTGYTDETLKFLKTAFNNIKKNETTCHQVLNSRRHVNSRN